MIATTIIASLVSLVSQTYADEPMKPQRAEELERLIRHDCGSCHGMTLKGGLGPDIRAQTLEGRSADSIAEIILEGVPGTPMPPWRPLLSQQDAIWIANYLLRGEKP